MWLVCVRWLSVMVLAGNKIGAEGAAHLGKGLETNKALTTLDLGGEQIWCMGRKGGGCGVMRRVHCVGGGVRQWRRHIPQPAVQVVWLYVWCVFLYIFGEWYGDVIWGGIIVGVFGSPPVSSYQCHTEWYNCVCGVGSGCGSQ